MTCAEFRCCLASSNCDRGHRSRRTAGGAAAGSVEPAGPLGARAHGSGDAGATVAVFVTGSPVARNPGFLAFPATMVVSLVVTALTGRGRRRGAAIDADRDEYLAYLSGLRDTVIETATAQCLSLTRAHPEPDTLWTLIGGPLMWRRQPGDPDFCRVRVGVGSQPLATRLVAAPTPPAQQWDPVTAAASSNSSHAVDGRGRTSCSH